MATSSPPITTVVVLLFQSLMFQEPRNRFELGAHHINPFVVPCRATLGEAAPISSTRFPPSLPLSTITIYIPQSPSPAKPNNYTSSTAHIQSVFSCSITDHHQIRTGNQSTQPASSISVAPPSQAHAAVTVKPSHSFRCCTPHGPEPISFHRSQSCRRSMPQASPVIPSTSLSPDVSLQYKAAVICHRRCCHLRAHESAASPSIDLNHRSRCSNPIHEAASPISSPPNLLHHH
ncbi:hypothetical protein M0R45_015205 [Rubus argutus]|uniref:Uncharacterized protein n=1 Tax=Rubus argutus TaxID=59490 RepID=A0AAW1XNT9_RUBAR